MKQANIKDPVGATPENMARYYADAKAALNQAQEKGDGVAQFVFLRGADGKDIKGTFVATSKDDIINAILSVLHNEPQIGALVMSLYVNQQIKQKQATGTSDVETMANAAALADIVLDGR